MQALDEFASKLIENEHYAHDDVAGRRDQLLQRRDRLYEAAQLRRHLLEESYKFQTFQRDCDETKSWINEKLKTANDENYLVSRFCLFDLILYVPSTIFQLNRDGSCWVEPVLK